MSLSTEKHWCARRLAMRRRRSTSRRPSQRRRSPVQRCRIAPSYANALPPFPLLFGHLIPLAAPGQAALSTGYAVAPPRRNMVPIRGNHPRGEPTGWETRRSDSRTQCATETRRISAAPTRRESRRPLQQEAAADPDRQVPQGTSLRSRKGQPSRLGSSRAKTSPRSSGESNRCRESR